MEAEARGKDSDVVEAAFNGSLQTLERIHNLILHISAYRVNNNIFGFRNNLSELLIESQGFLSKQEYVKAWKDWEKLAEFEISVCEDEEAAVYDDRLLLLLDRFNAWLRLKLHRHKVTMASKREMIHGLDKIKKKYGLDYGES